MKEQETYFHKFIEIIIPPGSDVRVGAFNILALCGILVSFVTGFYNLFSDFGILSFLECMAGVVISLTLMVYTHKTGNYRWAMIITVAVVFIGLFTFLFISNGGYESGIPYFFVFAIVFTAFLLDGKIMFLLVTIEIVWYAFLCFYTYYHPLEYSPVSEGMDFVMDVVVCETLVSAILATAMYFQMRLYRKKQKELNDAIDVAEEANKAKSEFLAKMSHDIRTPLNMIMAMNEMIVANTSSEQIREWVNDSNVSGQILLSLIDDMLDLTRIEAGRLNVLNQPWNAQIFFDETAKIWQFQAGRKGLDFNYTIDYSMPEYLMGDVGIIRKIVNNLLSNAVKYTKEGSVSFAVKYEQNIVIRVSDTGVGIAEEYREKIFKPFERGIQEIYRETSGSGLGLAIVKELIDAMNGTIDCQSTLGEGTEFTIIIPQKMCTSKEDVEKSVDKVNTIQKHVLKHFIAPSARILVVDDNSFNRKVVEGFLASTLIQIDDVESGEECLEMIDIKDYDLILMDLRMPKMDGVETLERIRKEYPDFDTPVVVLTADIMNGVEEKLLEKGFEGFLAKPVSSVKLYEMLSRFISDKMVFLETEEDDGLTAEQIEIYQDMLLPYGINLKLALEYNAGNTGEFLTRAGLFNEYAEAGISRLVYPDTNENYYLQIHSLKSGAKGVGAFLLAEMAETVEFRKDDTFRNCINTVLLDEYKRVCLGLNMLLKEVKA